MYGAHKGHNCELASNLAESALKDLQSIARNLADYHGQLLKARKTITQRKQNILDKENEVKTKIMKHFRYVRGAIARMETATNNSLDTMTKEKLAQVDKQAQ